MKTAVSTTTEPDEEPEPDEELTTFGEEPPGIPSFLRRGDEAQPPIDKRSVVGGIMSLLARPDVTVRGTMRLVTDLEVTFGGDDGE